jgi:mono/diheme cytochrome c family protein
MRFANMLGLLAPLLLVGCDDEFNYNAAHGGVVDGEGIDAVLDVMDGNCVGCHSGADPAAALDLDADFCDAVLDDRIVVEGDSAGSVLYQRISSETSPMPPNGLMDQANIDIVRDWIDAGADCSTDGSGGDATGDELFASRCASCHGDSGQGLGDAPALGDVVPGKDQAGVEYIILNGEGDMSAVGVTADEATLIAEYVLATWGG